jgi:TPR repeat protein
VTALALAAALAASPALAQTRQVSGTAPAPGLSLQDALAKANAGDARAQAAVGDAYFNGVGAPRDHAEARRWYEMAAKQSEVNASRRLGQMWANGDGGKKDTKRAVQIWQAAEKAGDPMAAILVADQLFSDLTGGRKPGPGKYAFTGGVPLADIDAISEWYQTAANSDPRPDVRQRATYALVILASLKKGAQTGR